MKINDRVRILGGFPERPELTGQVGRVDAIFPAYVAVDLDNGGYIGAGHDDVEVIDA